MTKLNAQFHYVAAVDKRHTELHAANCRDLAHLKTFKRPITSFSFDAVVTPMVAAGVKVTVMPCCNPKRMLAGDKNGDRVTLGWVYDSESGLWFNIVDMDHEEALHANGIELDALAAGSPEVDTDSARADDDGMAQAA